MRITNKIVQRNNLSNINTNKIYQDRLSTQMSTQKKVNRPSDDPIVAIRALRLRSSVTEVTQYYSKNIPDAKSWLNVTEDALKNLSQIVTEMIKQCTKGSNGPLKTEDRQIILEQLKALGDEIYSTGDADYAGRYVFTGFRTDTSLSFEKEYENLNYVITEQLGTEAIDSTVKVYTGDLLNINSANFDKFDGSDATHQKITEQQIDSVEVYRIRLAYNDCSTNAENLKIEYTDPATGNVMTLQDDVAAGMTPPQAMRVIHSYDDPYSTVAKDDGAVVFVPETGEVLLGKDQYEKLMAVKDNESTTTVNEAEIRVTYDKKHWLKGDLRPQHYFACKENTGWQDLKDVENAALADQKALYALVDKYSAALGGITSTDLIGGAKTPVDVQTAIAALGAGDAKDALTDWKDKWDKNVLALADAAANLAGKTESEFSVEYNQSYLTDPIKGQEIEYDVGFNQTIRVNSTADECFKHGIGREVDDVVNAMQAVLDLEGIKASLEKLQEENEGNDNKLALIKDQLDAVNKALTLAKNKEQTLFENGITAFQGYLDDANLCITNCGTRSSKLSLIDNRMQNQKTTFETLKSENEDIDITEVAIHLSSAELTYEAALMAAGKVMQTTLLNFI